LNRFQVIRIVVAFSAGSMSLGYFAGTYPASWTMSNLTRVISLFGSILLIVILIWLFTYSLSRAKASSPGKGGGSVFIAIISLIVTIAVIVLSMDWLVVSSIRPTSGFWSYLPHGNLFIAGGRDGWVYLGLFIMMGFAIIAEKLSVYLGFGLPSHKAESQSTGS
jgi:hypothetical protein